MSNTEILKTIQEIRDILKERLGIPVEQKISDLLLKTPSHLQPTVQALLDFGGTATAPMVSGITKRSRAVESGYLNSLVDNGKATKTKKGRYTFFSYNFVVKKE